MSKRNSKPASFLTPAAHPANWYGDPVADCIRAMDFAEQVHLVRSSKSDEEADKRLAEHAQTNAAIRDAQWHADVYAN